MQAERHLDILRTQGELVASLPVDMLGAVVPSMTDWTVERVVRHLGKIHQWVAATFAVDPTGGPADTRDLPGIPNGPDCLPAYRDALDVLLDAFGERDASAPTASFIGQAVDTAWWARRQAQEVCVHRTDAQDAVYAAGGPAPDAIPADAAADGIDEWAHLFLGTRWNQRSGDFPEPLVGRSVHIHGTDDPAPVDGAEWLLTFGTDHLDVAATHAKGDVALRGPAGDLLLVLWRRRPLDLIDVVGDAAVADQLLAVARF